jgi:5-methylcytosine-specific restriction endonuclease McrA
MGQHASLYKSKTWQRLRYYQLQREPLCRMCRQLGHIEPAAIVDHIKPHRGNLELFYDADNLAALCKPCHDRHKQRQEKTGVLIGGDSEGIPFDKNHHWNTKE